MRSRPMTALMLLAWLACIGCTAETLQALAEAEAEAANADDTPATDITDVIFSERSGDCAQYADVYVAFVLDVQRALDFEGMVDLSFDDQSCTLTSNGIPNHDFDDLTAAFATPASEQGRTFQIPRDPVVAGTLTPLSQQTWDAVMLNGVVLDLLSAGCYDPTSAMADAHGNVPIGCTTADAWLLDPLGTPGGFGTDLHNAHTQPDGTYHYHADPYAMFDDAPGPDGSPVIGFAADGFPIFGSYFFDGAVVRKAISGYTLLAGMRPDSALDPGGTYDGLYIDDYAFTNAGDLDECNGMTVDGQYGYYVTDTYPWVMNCFIGATDPSFDKGGPGGPPAFGP